MRIKRKCLVCGKEYEFCRDNDPDQPAWKNLFCSDNCHDIYNILSNEKDQMTAKIKLGRLDLSNLNNFNDEARKKINDIMHYSGKKEPRDFNKVAEKTANKTADVRSNESVNKSHK